MRILVTAGPTQEPVDSVRYITNASSGKMGFAIAAKAVGRGHAVCLVAGKTHINPPEGVRVLSVRTADEMTDTCLKELSEGYDVFVCAAAIGDYTPVKVESGKIKSGGELSIKLKPTRKLTKLACEKFKDLFVVGFKAEYNVSEDDLVASAREKLVGDGLDVIVANDIGKHRFGADETEVHFIGDAGFLEKKVGSKADIAGYLLSLIEKLN